MMYIGNYSEYLHYNIYQRARSPFFSGGFVFVAPFDSTKTATEITENPRRKSRVVEDVTFKTSSNIKQRPKFACTHLGVEETDKSCCEKHGG